MASMYKLMVSLVVLLFANSATAVIIEGRFSGQFWDTWGQNMEGAPDGKFWANDTGWGGSFTGNFWYDTDKVKTVVSGEEQGREYASYSGANDFLHIFLRRNGQELASSGTGSINVERYTDRYGKVKEFFSFGYGEGNGSSYRTGDISFSPYRQPIPFLDGLDLIQTFSFDGNSGYSPEYLGYMQFMNRGYINDVYYEGLVSGEINKFEIHVRVPEPSSWLLFLCALPLLMLRHRITVRTLPNPI